MSRRETHAELRPGRRRLFWALLLAFPVLLLAAIEGGVRLFLGATGPVDRYLTFRGRAEFFDTVEIDGRPHYRVSHPQAYRSRHLVFPVDKDPGTLRIFCLGGSASAGWPHPPSEIWTVHLQQALERAFPDRSFEVLNVGAHAYPSYRIRFLFERVLDLDPDFIVIYSGNNEFLESREYLRGWTGLDQVAALAERLATFRQLRDWWIRRRYPENALSGSESIDVSVNVWSKLARASLELREDPAQFERVQRHFAATIGAMVDRARERGVPLLLATVPVNLRDWVPNVSLDRLEGEERQRWQTSLAQGRAALLEGRADAAVAALRRAVAVAPEHAETHYYLGRALEQAGDPEAAVAVFERASDLDHNPFRAISAFNRTLRAAARADGVGLADLDAAFRAASAPRAPGFDLFLDYVHPNQAGGRIAARTVFEALLREGLVGTPPPADARFAYEPAPYFEDGRPYDEDLDDALQNTLFWLFGMMHQYQAMVDKAEHLRERGSQLPMLRPVLRVFRDELYLERRDLLGEPVSDAERERIERHVADFYRHTYKFEAP